MKLSLNDVAFEPTRRCNLVCHHCMRGPGQNMDMSPKFIDAFLKEMILNILITFVLAEESLH